MSKGINLSHPIVSVVLKSVNTHMTTNHSCVVMLTEMLSHTVLQDFVHDSIRKLMFCSTNFVTTLLSAFRKGRLVCQIFLST